MAVFTDTHAHLDFPQLAEEIEAVLSRANTAGIRRMISIGTTVESSRRAIALAEKHPNVWATVGIHPSNVEAGTEGDLPALGALAAHPRVVAIGEIGLDYHWLPGAVAAREGKRNAENSGELAQRDAELRAHQSLV